MTQITGLNDYARTFLSTNPNIKKIGSSVIGIGMFEEKIYGDIYEEIVNKYHTLRYEEVIQDRPWSSGPMVFTHLKVTLLQACNDKRFDMGFYFSWMIDPSVKDSEFDYETGRYYV